MDIPGYAFHPDERSISETRAARYKEIAHLRPMLKMTKEMKYGHTLFHGVLTDDTRHLSEFDLALIADCGNLCFGGKCFKYGDEFHGHYYTD